jgi:LPS sulfotransferase NodH
MGLPTNDECLRTFVPESAARTWGRPGNAGAVLIFTPRAGSTWLCDLLRSTNVFGDPQEYLNQELFPISAQRFRARTETDYLNGVETLTISPNGRYCIAATWGQIALCAYDFLGRYEGMKFLYLRRRDILAQAVSLHLAVATGRFHTTGDTVGAEPRVAWSAEVAAAIARWWGHLLNYECLTEIQFAVRGIAPLRLYYEDVISCGPDAVRSILEFCGVIAMPSNPTSTHERTGGELNAILKESFEAERGDFIREMNALRPPLGG